MRSLPVLLALFLAAPLAAQSSPAPARTGAADTEAAAPGDGVGGSGTSSPTAGDGSEGARTGDAAPAAPAQATVGLRLAPPFPNPVRGAGSFRFVLPEAADVRLSLFDALGREVAVLAEGAEGAGTHVVSFDVSRLTPGAYLARLTAGEQTSVQRVTVRG
ncbi:MAG TPA: T9SS type A sorting domain-containing protein [Rhodothermales bacterium]|nr:T9SS type A sorting domain-containing protein [Rhodothermales bacterium]